MNSHILLVICDNKKKGNVEMQYSSFADLHFIKYQYFNVFIIDGVTEPVETYVRKQINSLLHLGKDTEKSIKERVEEMFNLPLLNGLYTEEDLESYVENLGSNRKLENCDYGNLFSINFTGASRLCVVNLSDCTEKDFDYYLTEIKTRDWGERIEKHLESGNPPIYVIFTFDSVLTDDKNLTNLEYKLLQGRKKRLNNLKESLFESDRKGLTTSRRLLWVSAKGKPKVREVYNWAYDLLGDKVTKDLLWECSSACGELVSLRGFYKECLIESEARVDDRLLGEEIKKKDLRKHPLYQNLIYIDGKLLAKCSIRFINDKDYLGRNLKSIIRLGTEIETGGKSGNRDTYSVGLRKLTRFLRETRFTVEKWYRLRSLIECGVIPSFLSREQLAEKNVVNVLDHYKVNYATTSDLEIANSYKLEDFYLLIRLLEEHINLATETLKNNSKLEEIGEHRLAELNLFSRYFTKLSILRGEKFSN